MRRAPRPSALWSGAGTFPFSLSVSLPCVIPHPGRGGVPGASYGGRVGLTGVAAREFGTTRHAGAWQALPGRKRLK